MTLAELGAKLREERVSLGLTVEDVAMRLKVPARILRAIEDGDSADLPHTVYTRGFIKGYGLILGYSSEIIMEMIDSLVGFSEDFSPPKTLEAQPNKDEKPRTKRLGFGLGLKLLVVMVLCAGGYAYYTHTYRDGDLPQFADLMDSDTSNSAEQKNNLSAVPVANNAAASSTSSTNAVETPSAPWTPAGETSTPSSSATTSTMPGSVPSAVSGGMMQDGEISASPMNSQSQPDTAATSTNAAIAATPAHAAQNNAIPNTQRTEADPVKPSGLQTLPASSTPAGSASTLPASANIEPLAQSSLPAGMHQMVLTAEAECWVHANADGTDTRQFSLKAGETFAMPFKKSMVLKLGNAGGVKIKYDGVELPPQGGSGQVKTITLPPKA